MPLIQSLSYGSASRNEFRALTRWLSVDLNEEKKKKIKLVWSNENILTYPRKFAQIQCNRIFESGLILDRASSISI